MGGYCFIIAGGGNGEVECSAGVSFGALVSCGCGLVVCGAVAPPGGVMGCSESSSLRVSLMKRSTEGDRFWMVFDLLASCSWRYRRGSLGGCAGAGWGCLGFCWLSCSVMVWSCWGLFVGIFQFWGDGGVFVMGVDFFLLLRVYFFVFLVQMLRSKCSASLPLIGVRLPWLVSDV